MSILFLNPVLKTTVWGGTRLKEYGYDLPSNKVGECWGISAHPNGDCEVAEGEYKGAKLSTLWAEHRELFDNVKGEQFPLLTKIIAAEQDLSIQVHPDNDYAGKNENGSLGKMECWYVLDADPNTNIIVGHNAQNDDELKSMIDNHQFKELIRETPIKKGDFFQINPGTVHAIKGGTVILETQQSSDITYRLYDYDRLDNGKLRELHLDKSKDVIVSPYKAPSLHPNGYKETANKAFDELVNTEYYTVWKLALNGEYKLIQDQHFMLVSVVEGNGEINGHVVAKGSHFIICSDEENVDLRGDMTLIISSVN
ncbi:MAG: mannose-6-phosphate isomerase, class I [Lachnospiraceae bacterium]|nr:mannose-6-phosphate isomerase, class I [Lachnospiraceae bacterium]